MLRCPVCHKTLTQNDKQFTCDSHHSFDVSKNGSVYLSKSHSLKMRGDNKLQIEARHKFHQKDHYKLIKETLVQILSEYEFSNCLDIGCGEGYYTDFIAKSFPSVEIYGLDLSKEAIHFAAKKDKHVQYIIANNKELPFVDHRIDMVTALFTPIYLEEILRVLKPYGYLITVQAGTKHLYELKEQLYENVILNDEKRLQNPKLIMVENQRISQRIHLDKESKNQLLEMTPYFYTSPQDKVKEFLKLEEIDLTLSVVISIYQRQP